MADRKVTVPGIKGRPVTVLIRGENVRISRTAKFGPGVVLSDVKINAGCEIGARSKITHSSIDARTVIGEHSKISQMNIGARVRIGSRADCHNGAIGDRADIGERFRLSGVSVATIVAGNDVQLESFWINSTIGSGTRIGDDTQIDFPWGHSVIEAYVGIGARCRLRSGKIEGAVMVGDDVTLYYCQRIGDSTRIGAGAKICRADIGIHTVIGEGAMIGEILTSEIKIGNRVRIGAYVTVRPGVVIPDNWEIPRSTIVNPHPSHPIIIPKTP